MSRFAQPERPLYYKLNPDHSVSPLAGLVGDSDEAMQRVAAAFAEDRTLALATFDLTGVKVSTVFLCLDHAFGDRPPLLFETMIFGGPLDQWQRRYSTWYDAMAGHTEAVTEALLAGALSGRKEEQS